MSRLIGCDCCIKEKSDGIKMNLTNSQNFVKWSPFAHFFHTKQIQWQQKWKKENFQSWSWMINFFYNICFWDVWRCPFIKLWMNLHTDFMSAYSQEKFDLKFDQIQTSKNAIGMQYITLPSNATCHNLLKCIMNCNIAAVRRQPFVKLDLVIDQWSAPQLNQLRKFDLFSSTNHVTAFLQWWWFCCSTSCTCQSQGVPDTWVWGQTELEIYE